MEKLYGFLKIFLWANVGGFCGRTVGRVWEYCAHPDRFAMLSAPWYLGIQVSAVSATIIACILLIAIFLIGRKLGKPTKAFRLLSQISLSVALCTCVWLGFELFGYHTDYDIVTVEATILAVCFAINLACAVLRVIQEKQK